jgi:hypothetical protein
LTDPEGAQLFRELVERVWPPDNRLPTGISVADYRTIVTALDETPQGAAVTLGRKVREKRGELWRSGEQQGFTAILDLHTLLLYTCKSLDSDDDLPAFDAEIGARTAARLSEMKEQGCDDPRGIGIGHAVTAEGVASRYVYIEGEVEVRPEIRIMVMHELGRLLLSEGRTEQVGQAKRNRPCPCGSGLKFKKCDLVARGLVPLQL